MKPITGIAAARVPPTATPPSPPSRRYELAPPHCRPRGYGRGIVSAKIRALEGVMRCPLWVISGLRTGQL